jgi:tetratricopeptide (TPR) repeat protein
MYASVADEEPDADVAFLMSRLGMAHAFSGSFDRATELFDRALDVAEALQATETMVRAWMGKATVLMSRRPTEVRALYRLALETALEHDILRPASTAATNLSDFCFHRDRYAEALEYLDEARGLSARAGSRITALFVVCEQTYALTMLGRWDEAFARLAELPDDQIGTLQLTSLLTGVLEIHLRRGDLVAADELLRRYEDVSGTGDVQASGGFAAGSAAVAAAEGRYRDALVAAERAIAGREALGLGAQDVKQGLRHALESALALGETQTVERLLAIVDDAPQGLRPPFLAALAHRFRARLAGDVPAADRHYAAAVAQFRALELPFDEAVVSVEYAEWLERIGRPDEAAPLRENASEIFGYLRAAPWLERASATEAVPVD